MKRNTCDKKTASAPISEELSGDVLHNVSQWNWAPVDYTAELVNIWPCICFHISNPFSVISALLGHPQGTTHTQTFISVSASLGTQPKTNVLSAHEFFRSIRTLMSMFSVVGGN